METLSEEMKIVVEVHEMNELQQWQEKIKYMYTLLQQGKISYKTVHDEVSRFLDAATCHLSQSSK